MSENHPLLLFGTHATNKDGLQVPHSALLLLPVSVPFWPRPSRRLHFITVSASDREFTRLPLPLLTMLLYLTVTFCFRLWSWWGALKRLNRLQKIRLINRKLLALGWLTRAHPQQRAQSILEARISRHSTWLLSRAGEQMSLAAA